MPYTIRRQADHYVAELSGVLTRLDLVRLLADAWEIEDREDSTPDRIVDLSGIERYDIDWTAMLAAAEDRMSRSVRNRVRAAFVAPRQIDVGFARMYQTLNEHPDVQVRIFSSSAEAERWLVDDSTAA